MAYRDDLTAAMARAEAAERALAGVCAVHTSKPSVAECSACKRTFCEACVMTTEDAAVLCTTCYVAYTARRRGRRLAVVAAGLTLAGAAAFGFVAMGRKRTDEMVKALPLPGGTVERPKYSTMPNRIRVLRETLAADACNRDAALELAKLLNENLAYPETLEANGRFLGKCGGFPELVWTSVYAREQRSEWADAVKLSSELIAGEPTDADFWWWRGKDRAELGQLAAAAADFRQSLAAGGQWLAAFRFAAVAEKMEDFCEGAFAIRSHVTFGKGVQKGDAWDRFKQLYTAGACDDLTGHGKAVIKFKPDVPLVQATLDVGAVRGAFIVDASAGYLTVTRAFADKAGLTVAAEPVVSTYVMGELRDARLAVADKVALAGATAGLVHVAVVDSLAPGLDGLVGLSFLWRFSVERDDERGTITLTGWGE